MRAFLLLPLLLLAGCDWSDGGTGNGPCATAVVGTGPFTATTPSGTFTARCVSGSLSNGLLWLGGTLGAERPAGVVQEQITLALPGAAAGQTVTLGSDATATYARLTTADASGTYAAMSGSVVIARVSASGAKGTFSFTGRNTAGATVQITGGSFDVTF